VHNLFHLFPDSCRRAASITVTLILVLLAQSCLTVALAESRLERFHKAATGTTPEEEDDEESSERKPSRQDKHHVIKVHNLRSSASTDSSASSSIYRPGFFPAASGCGVHPSEWRWCGHDELSGGRLRYTILSQKTMYGPSGKTVAITARFRCRNQ